MRGRRGLGGPTKPGRWRLVRRICHQAVPGTTSRRRSGGRPIRSRGPRAGPGRARHRPDDALAADQPARPPAGRHPRAWAPTTREAVVLSDVVDTCALAESCCQSESVIYVARKGR